MQPVGASPIAIGAASVAALLFYGYALQAIADKREVSQAARLLAWLPGLQIYTLVKCGEADFGRFAVVVGAGLFVSGTLLWLAPAPIGPEIPTLLASLWGSGALLYLGRLFWVIALRRGFRGELGLLVLIPGVNLFALPYLAFYDGLVAPRPSGVAVGVAIGVALCLGVVFSPLSGSGPPLLQSSGPGETAVVNGGAPGAQPVPTAADAPDPLVRGEEANTAADPDALPECPIATASVGAPPPHGFEWWCARGGLKHGPYRTWHPSSGAPMESGRYADGLRVGLWTRWYADGTRHAQAGFEAGLQHGRFLVWNRQGELRREQRFDQGLLLR